MNCNKYKWLDNNILFDKNILYRKSMSAMYHKCKIKQCYIHKLYYMHIDYHKYMKVQCYNHTKYRRYMKLQYHSYTSYHKYRRVQCHMHIDYHRYNLKRYYNHTSYRKCNLKRYCNRTSYHRYNLKRYCNYIDYRKCMRVLCYNHTNNHMSNKFYVLHKNIHTYKYSLNYSLSKTKYYKYTHVQKYTKCYINSY